MTHSIKELAIIIHTEEEFNWSEGFYRANNKVNHGDELIAFGDKLIAIGAKITFAVDYAFVQSEHGRRVIKYFLPYINKNVEFAAHLHPWVNPPYQDDIEPLDLPFSAKYTFPGNLPKDLEHKKLQKLTEAIDELIGQQPTTYLAGRYGVGENTAEVLSILGYNVDVSISPFADFSHEQGPDFSAINSVPCQQSTIANIPHSTSIVSIFPALSRFLNNKPEFFKRWNKALLGKILFKLFKVDKYRLSPEGFNLKQMQKVTTTLAGTGVDSLIFSFHSPSVKLGLTPYVATEHDLQCFYENTINYILWYKNNIAGEFKLINRLRSQ